MENLPTELHYDIFRGLSEADLVVLARVSSRLRHRVEPILYAHVDVSDLGKPRTHYEIFRTAILARPDELGPLVHSLQISDFHNNIPWDEPRTAELFRAMSSLRRLVLRKSDGYLSSSLFSDVFSAVSPSLTEFECDSVGVGPGIHSFLNIHPNLTVWRQWKSGADHWQTYCPSPNHLPLPNLKACEIECHCPELVASLLRRMVNLTDLTIDYSVHTPALLGEAAGMNEQLAAFDACGANITRLSMCGIPTSYFSLHGLQDRPFTWILMNVLPRTQNLRQLQLRHPIASISRSPYSHRVIFPSERIQPADFARLESIKWVSGDALEYCGAGLSSCGAQNADALFALFPSLRILEYYETGHVHVFRRLGWREGGTDIVRWTGIVDRYRLKKYHERNPRQVLFSEYPALDW
ncbi:uncharacterized protein STEHIDRAFT_153472 [Stereum hirsutum FP-91666 SS1]|uniref:uncharacterized protein n=1 Tax=Stereum hirsutum (strain FP-91666) TaxID=721885 RepID=UPI000440F7DF|nr:uncharacterized protein STEHIDRAFT_153472 [Stereum hirsutum FP-91666 SS1]EIM89625.1 hypothetical protein STEHIDRAFT_153472 [Stereum hirsutum FP-91666 SS1]